jgi:hypothetical protein
MKPLYIFDLDGTLALCDHRRPILDNVDNPDRWRDFFAACTDDAPNVPVIDTLHALLEAGAEVWIWSGRSAEVMEQTKAWLQDHLGEAAEDVPLCMRLEWDFTPNEELKASWLAGMSSYDRRRLVAVFDDQDKVVGMWRANGVPCFQIAPGDF